MCGIIGVIGERNATPILVEGLKRLEYRGYDSAGIAVLNHAGEIQISRSKGKLIHLENRLAETPRTGLVGIGHTRWATHGPPTEQNAHPHLSRRVAVVHNGIIENYQELRRELTAVGVTFLSDTDTEVIPHLIERELERGLQPTEAVRVAIKHLQGAYALGILIQGADLLIAVRRGSPLILGLGEGENFIASDATPLVPYTRRMIYLHDDDLAVLTRTAVRITDLQGHAVDRSVKISHVSADLTDKWPYRHYMQKEIFEQPTVLGETLKGLLNGAEQTIQLPELDGQIDLNAVAAVQIIACGTSYHSGMVAGYWIEHLARLPVGVHIASEFRYREPPSMPGTITVVISQSGETADTLAALRYCRSQGQKVLAIVNVPESSIAREADGVLYTQAGPEIGVASTKAFTTQLMVLACLTLALARAKGRLTDDQEKRWVEELMRIPARVEQVLLHDEILHRIAGRFTNAKGFLFMGRGTCYPIALEGALKLKEISYIHAEGYAAGEMKHGPIALIDAHLPVVAVAPRDPLFDKLVSNLEEARARGGRLVVITSGRASEETPFQADHVIPMPECGMFAAPILYVVPLQLLAYHIAVLKGTDVDQPRNLAKSVTVE
ncbi:MAG: glutamine--fructose-6-phosphate transaminase (isomerizing) [Magnetococcales bacterium]|nr:glutamine--fructose-6-phosphate transaminase (isomerizing) [Magnetococcales bacterium]NGZ05552.1 glutamine--fructose-6-phosphate transaminase (isomerizing) [Magnetococcales bacterium]